jgi:hypothetical protein
MKNRKWWMRISVLPIRLVLGFGNHIENHDQTVVFCLLYVLLGY